MNWDKLRKRIKGTVVTAAESEFTSLKASMVWNEISPIDHLMLSSL